MDVLVGDKGFLTCKDTNQWRLHTKLCRSALRVINNSSLGIKINEEADCLTNKMLDYHGKAFNPCQDLYLASLNILCNISFGERYSHNDPELHEILDYSAQILKVISPVHPVNALPLVKALPQQVVRWSPQSKGQARQTADEEIRAARGYLQGRGDPGYAGCHAGIGQAGSAGEG